MRILTFAAILLLGAPLAAAPVPKELKRKPDSERICGLWIYDRIDTGNGVTNQSGRWIFRPGKLYAGGTDTAENLGSEYGIVLRPALASEPCQMDITQGGRPTCFGVYKFEGEELHISYVHTGDRPKDFNSAPARTVLKLKLVPESK